MAAARGVSETTQQRVLTEIERDPMVTDVQLAARLSLRPSTIYTSLLQLEGRKLIQRDMARHVWERTTPPWMR